jgi:hypothetical protein
MKTSLKEAYNIAQKTFPGFKVQVEVKIGSVYNFEHEHGIRWEIRLQKENSKAAALEKSDPIFAIAIAKLTAEVMRSRIKGADDVEIGEGKVADDVENSEARPEEPEEKVDPDELPF